MWKCPVCQSTQTLSVVVQVSAKLIQGAGDSSNFETEITGGDHEWDDDAQMACECGFLAPATQFDTNRTGYPFPAVTKRTLLKHLLALGVTSKDVNRLIHGAVEGLGMGINLIGLGRQLPILLATDYSPQCAFRKILEGVCQPGMQVTYIPGTDVSDRADLTAVIADTDGLYADGLILVIDAQNNEHRIELTRLTGIRRSPE